MWKGNANTEKLASLVLMGFKFALVYFRSAACQISVEQGNLILRYETEQAGILGIAHILHGFLKPYVKALTILCSFIQRSLRLNCLS